VVLLVMNNHWNLSYIDMLSQYIFNTVGKGDGGGFIPTWDRSVARIFCFFPTLTELLNYPRTCMSVDRSMII